MHEIPTWRCEDGRGAHDEPDRGVGLYTATLRIPRPDGSVVEMLHACVVASRAEVLAHLRARIGPALAPLARVQYGIDVEDDTVLGLLGQSVAASIRNGDGPCAAALVAGGAIHVEQHRG